MTQELRRVRSFSLSPTVIECVDAIPSRERSRIIDQVLRQVLPLLKPNAPILIIKQEVRDGEAGR